MTIKTIDQLIAARGFERMTPGVALRHVGQLVEVSQDQQRLDGLARAVTLASQLRPRLNYEAGHVYLDFSEANAWAVLGNVMHRGRPSWERPEFEKQITCLRRAARLTSSRGVPGPLRSQVHTNLGNALSGAGRVVEAIRAWDEAIRLTPRFSMAIGNRAVGIFNYSRMIYDDRHAAVLLKWAHKELARLGDDVEPHAGPYFGNTRRKIEEMFRIQYLASDFRFGEPSVGRSIAERGYRNWCLKNRLFLNPLNDAADWPVAARDVLSVPSIVVKVGEGPHFHGFSNQIRHEFISARYLYYAGLNARGTHFSDKHVLTHDTFDYANYGLPLEQIKCAYRVLYSLFDKVAYFLNHYLALGIPERKVTFKTLWYEEKQKGGSKVLRTCFANAPNPSLLALFWVSKDLFEEQAGTGEPMLPEGRAMKETRDHLEHKYLKVHHDLWVPDPGGSRMLTDDLAYHIRRSDLIARTLDLMHMARAAIIYLSCAIHDEERRRAASRAPSEKVGRMHLGRIPDREKR